MTAYPWLTLRGRTYYLRAPVPTDIKNSFGRAEIWKSLRTQDRKVAIKKLRKETAIVAEEFEKHRASQARLAEPPLWELTDQQIKAIEDIYLEHLLDEDEELRLSGFEGRDFDEEMGIREGFDEVSREGYAKGSVSSFILGEAEEVLTWDDIEVRLDPSSPSWPKVFRALHAAIIKANKAIRERDSGEVVETPRVELKAFRAASKPTLEEAKDFYITERVSGSEFARKKRINRLEANMRSVKEALGEIPALPDFTVDHAYAVRDYLLNKGTLKPSSVRRELNDIKGIFSLYKDKKLRTMVNPFEGLELPKSTETDKDAREPLPSEVIEAVKSLVIEKANPDLALIWRLLQGTGCRLAEITGLRVEDVLFDGNAPYLCVVSHPSRRLKSKSSEREIPLVGDAGVAASEALQAAKGKNFLFERYAGPVGPNTASQSLMKWLRKVSKDPRHTVHSLRHNMADRCDLAGVNPTDKAALLGHLSGGASERYYGSRAARRATLSRAMNIAFGTEHTANDAC